MVKRRNKSDAQRRHAKRRFLERFGINLTPELSNLFVRSIQKGEALLVDKQSLRIGVYDLTYRKKKLRLVYDRRRQNIVTVLFPEESVGVV